MIKKWVINTPDNARVRELSEKTGVSGLAAMALVSMGADTPEKAVRFFGGSEEDGEDEFSKGFSDPFLLKDMDKACETINSAVDSGELICIYGDYDCDGITAAAVLSGYLLSIGADVITHINEREQGYGMNADAVRSLKEKGVSLIITVDNGISAIEEAALCKELGMKLVITDHHRQGDTLPEADAIVNAHRLDCPSPYKDYCGCGLALKLIAALEGGDMEHALEQYSDLAAIATVADVVPLTGENRMIVRHGLYYLENTENPGLRALMEKAGIKPPFTSSKLAFQLAPRINAAGRIASPSLALSLLTEEDPDRAAELAEEICDLNEKRKEYENAVVADIAALIREDASLLDKRVLVFRGTGWHHGVIGLAASRCGEKYGKPVFLMSANEGEEEIRGSARSVEGFNVFDALCYAKEALDKFGGHEGAGGFSLTEEKAERFDELLQKYAAECAAEGKKPVPAVNVCGSVSVSELTPEAVEGLDGLEPFGEGNPRPVFLLPDAVISDIIPLKEGAHTKLVLTCGRESVTGLMFGMKTAELPFKRGDAVNALVSPEINEFRGNISVNVHIKDIRMKGINQQKLISALETYGSFRRKEPLDEKILRYIKPGREDFGAVYRAAGDIPMAPAAIYGRVAGKGINYCKFLLCLDVFSEAGLMDYDRCAEKVKVIKGAPKADLESTPTMQSFGG